MHFQTALLHLKPLPKFETIYYGLAKAKVSCGSLTIHIGAAPYMVTQVAPTPTCYFLELSLPHVKVPMIVRPLHALLHQVAGKQIGMLDHPNQCVFGQDAGAHT
ncbi:hypothetical protein L3X38_009127 [Prunus dulcis]|uniref:Uncharacterized protein n=1 Tax=Prunus dulcis TaxID=3755 RepID=A0AAD4ZXU8_PRUDU|nr:hypothetical protein L3X38_009127 [Prunus dulcis]